MPVITTSEAEWAASAIIAVLPDKYPVKAFPAAKPISAARPNRNIFSPSAPEARWWWLSEWP